ncbi:MAG: pilus assembly protein [Anaerolineales bacterium]|nr:pilus assembly protein [Anaerolineales bacterium]
MYARIGREEGQQIILVSLMLPILLVFVGLVIDVGNLYFHRRTAQNAADAAAVAGSVQLPLSNKCAPPH